MPNRSLPFLLVALLLPLTVHAGTTSTTTSASASTSASAYLSADPSDTKAMQKATIAQQLETLQNTLAVKKQELATLRHRWMLQKGRTPTAAELQAYEEKLKKGTASVADNPYVNKSTLSTPAPRRIAYYKKLQEIKQTEDRIKELEQDLIKR